MFNSRVFCVKLLKAEMLTLAMGIGTLSIYCPDNIANADGAFVGYRVAGTQSEDGLGTSLKSTSDLNGDGISDILYQNKLADSLGGILTDVGMVGALSGANGARLFEVRGEVAGDQIGSGGFQEIADVNNDQIPDVFILSPLADAVSLTDCGEWRIVSGATGTLLGKASGSQAGEQLGSNGFLNSDINGDTRPDVIVASSLTDSNKGAVKGFLNDGTTIFSILGDSANDQLSSSGLHLLSDVDTDGVSDFAVVSAQIDNTSVVDTGGFKVVSAKTGTVLYTRYGDFANDRLGTDFLFLSPLFDANGDLHPDIVIASSLADSASAANDNVGAVKVYSSVDGNPLYTIRGRFSNDRLSIDTTSVHRSVQFGPDVNSDGVADLLLNATFGSSSNGANDDAGLTRVISGANGAILYDVAGTTSDGRLGYLPLGIFDVTGDLVPDFLFRSVRGDTSSSVDDNIGRVRMVNGVTGATVYELLGTFANDGVPSHAGILDDYTGDGIVDFFFAGTTSDSAQGANDDVGRLTFVNGATGAVTSSILGDFAGDRIPTSSLLFGPEYDVDNDGISDAILFSNVIDSAAGANDDVGGALAVSSSTGAVSYRIKGRFAQDKLGTTFRPATDITGDDVFDFYIGSATSDSEAGANDDVGYIALYSGASGDLIFELFGNSPGDQISLQGSVVIDVNGDSLLDRVFGAPLSDSQGKVDGGEIIALIADRCPDDTNKTMPGICGCGVSDIDSDNDGTADCVDLCSTDVNKTAPGVCGCGVIDADTNTNGIIDCDRRDALLTTLEQVEQFLTARLERNTLNRKSLRMKLTEVSTLLVDATLVLPGGSQAKESFISRLSAISEAKRKTNRLKEARTVRTLGRKARALLGEIKQGTR